MTTDETPVLDFNQHTLARAVSLACVGNDGPLAALMLAYASECLLKGGDVSVGANWTDAQAKRLLEGGNFAVLERWIEAGLSPVSIRRCYASLADESFIPVLDEGVRRFGLDSDSVDWLIGGRNHACAGDCLSTLGVKRVLAWCAMHAPSNESAAAAMEAVMEKKHFTISEWIPLLAYVTSTRSRNKVEQVAVRCRSKEEVEAVRSALGSSSCSFDTLIGNAMDGDAVDEVARLMADSNKGHSAIAKFFLRGVRSGAVNALRVLIESKPGYYWTPSAWDLFRGKIHRYNSGRSRTQHFADEVGKIAPYRKAGLVGAGCVSSAAVEEILNWRASTAWEKSEREHTVAFLVRHGLCSNEAVQAFFVIALKRHFLYGGRGFTSVPEPLELAFSKDSFSYLSIPVATFVKELGSMTSDIPEIKRVYLELYGEECPKSLLAEMKKRKPSPTPSVPVDVSQRAT